MHELISNIATLVRNPRNSVPQIFARVARTVDSYRDLKICNKLLSEWSKRDRPIKSEGDVAYVDDISSQ